MAITQMSSRANNPIDLVEDLATRNDWPMERATPDELTLTVAGQWTDYHVSLNWRDDLETLHIACAFDAKVPDNRLPEVYRLIAQINEQLWLWVPFAVIFPLIFFHHSRSLWLALDHFFNPPDKLYSIPPKRPTDS